MTPDAEPLLHARRLWYLRLVVKRGSFAAAATEAGVTQPAITLALQALEREVGVELFEPVGRRRQPTPAAIRIAEGVGRLNESIDSLVHPREDPQAPARDASLRVGLLPGSGHTFGAGVAAIWRAHHPAGRLVLRMEPTMQLLDMLREDQLDLAILPRPRHLDMTGIAFDVLRSSRPVICARKDHPMAGAQSLAALQDAGAQWAVTGLLPTGNEVIEEAHRVRSMSAPDIAAYCPDVITLLQVVANTDLLCVVSHPELIDSGLRRLIEPIRIMDNLPRLETCLFTRTGRRARHRVEIAAIRQGLRAQVV